jgi:hypothetical protein
MTGLPDTLTVDGVKYRINADFRNILRIIDALNDVRLSDIEKAFIAVQRIYNDDTSGANFKLLTERAYWFIGGGDMPQSKPSPVPLIDWYHDEQMMMPAVSKAVGVVDIRTLDFLHWWTFLGMFGEIGEGLFSTVLHIRQKKSQGKKLEKWEDEFFRNHKELIVIRSPEEQSEIDATRRFLDTIT